MQRDMEAPYVRAPDGIEICVSLTLLQVSLEDFLTAARNVRRQITPEMIQHFEAWQKTSGLRSA